ncbi:hypothetical protein DITRI_Ditri04bG0006600 [Diplodiscus trichospermus]
MLFCAAKSIGPVKSSLPAEILAIQYGLDLAMEHGFADIQLESDCKVAISEILKQGDSLCAWDSLSHLFNPVGV